MADILFRPSVRVVRRQRLFDARVSRQLGSPRLDDVSLGGSRSEARHQGNLGFFEGSGRVFHRQYVRRRKTHGKNGQFFLGRINLFFFGGFIAEFKLDRPNATNAPGLF